MVSSRWTLRNEEKADYISAMGEELTSLRATAGISQGDLANILGISRQTYSSIETEKKDMSWSTYLSLAWFFDNCLETRDQFGAMLAYPETIISRINEGVDLRAQVKNQAIVEVVHQLKELDEPAIHALKTMLLVEYTRCRKISGDAVVRAFEGTDFLGASVDTIAEKALRNIRRRQY